MITVAAVLVISRALAGSGAIDALAGRLIEASSPILAFGLVLRARRLLSGFMNNVGALALLMPVALAPRVVMATRRYPVDAAVFATLLGGMTTLIGTPPNLLIAAFRAEATGERFLLFDFTPMGVAVSVAGIAYLLLIGWRLLPAGLSLRRAAFFEVGAPSPRRASVLRRRSWPRCRRVQSAGAPMCGGRPRGPPAVRSGAGGGAASRGHPAAAGGYRSAREHRRGGPAGAPQRGEREPPEAAGPNLMEAVVLPNAVVQGSSPLSLDLGRRYGVNLVAAARQGRRSKAAAGRTLRPAMSSCWRARPPV